MNGRLKHASRPLAVAALLALLSAGCAAFNEAQNTHISVQFSTEETLHIASVPRRLPDGSRPQEELRDLLDKVARAAGSYTYIENVIGGRLYPNQKEPVQELHDLLLVRGGPDVAAGIYWSLKEDFGQEHPLIVSLPVLPTAARVPAPPPAAEPEPEEPAS